MTRTPEDIHKALDTGLSGVSQDPLLFDHITTQKKGATPPMKHKLSFSLVFVLILIFLASAAAIAATYHGVSHFLHEGSYSIKDGELQQLTLDPAYIMHDVQHYHTGKEIKKLQISLTDAYWDGVDFSLACHIAPLDSAHTLWLEWSYSGHPHYRSSEGAHIMITKPEFINVTTPDGREIYRPTQKRFDFLYEPDGSISLMIQFPLYDLSQAGCISIPFSYTMADTGEHQLDMLHCYPPTLPDPIPLHEHQWKPATCNEPKTCAICSRTEGEAADHDFWPAENESYFACTRCSETTGRFELSATSIIWPGERSNISVIIKHRLRELGYYDGPFHASYDTPLILALQKFQKDHGLISDGVCHPETIRLLFPEKNPFPNSQSLR